MCCSSRQHSFLTVSLELGLRNADTNQSNVLEGKIFKEVEHSGQHLKAIVVFAAFNAVVLFAWNCLKSTCMTCNSLEVARQKWWRKHPALGDFYSMDLLFWILFCHTSVSLCTVCGFVKHLVSQFLLKAIGPKALRLRNSGYDLGPRNRILANGPWPK